MIKQMKPLIKNELCNLYGINVFRHSRDKKEKVKSIAIVAVIAVLLIMLLCYVGAVSYGLIMLGADSLIPSYLMLMATIFVFIFSIFKTGSLLFQKKGYDMLAALPVSTYAIMGSRFARLYVENMVVALFIMLPGMGVYAVMLTPPIWAYVVALIGTMAIPLVPLSIAVGLGTIITKISSRMKHKALVETALSLLMIIGVFYISNRMSQTGEEFTMEMMVNLAEIATKAIGKIYPPAIMFQSAVIYGNMLQLGFFLLISVALAMLMVYIAAKNFLNICRYLYETGSKNKFKMQSLKRSTIKKALVKKEAKRYFSSGVYVTNTILGPVGAVAMGIALFFFDTEALSVNIPIEINIKMAVPFLMAAILGMMNPTGVSVSMEGKEWWIAKTLPLSTKDILDGKLIFNFCLLTPFYLISEVCMLLALRPSVMEIIWMIIIPPVFAVFSCIFGIRVNLWFPKMNWENEAVVVKQSVASLIGGLGGVLCALLCGVAVLLMPAVYQNYILPVVIAGLLLLTLLLYKSANKTNLKAF